MEDGCDKLVGVSEPYQRRKCEIDPPFLISRVVVVINMHITGFRDP